MKQLNFLPAIPFIFLLFACQKEESFESGGNVPGSTEGVLIKTFLEDEVSTMEYLFGHNSSQKVVNTMINATAGALGANVDIRFTRNNAGRITSARWILRSSLTPDKDTLDFTLHYDAGGRLLYGLLKPTDFLTNGYDSSVYTFNASNKMTVQIVYWVTPGQPDEYLQRIEYTYTGDNVTQMKNYDLLGSLTAMKLVETTTYTYDNRPAAQSVSEDESLVGGFLNGVPSVNNITRQTVVNEEDPSENVITEYKYTYANPGKPSFAEVFTTRPGLPQGKAKLTFFYK